MYDSTTEMRAEIEHLSGKMRGVVNSIQHALIKTEALPSDVTSAGREVATLVKKGMTCKEIAGSRGIGFKSVENARVALRKNWGWIDAPIYAPSCRNTGTCRLNLADLFISGCISVRR